MTSVVFMGTPKFAVPALNALHESSLYEVKAVYSRKDSVNRRGKAIHPTPVKEYALAHGIEVETPSTLRESRDREILQALNPDLIIVAAFGMILPPEVLAIPQFGCINIHGSLLPRWRGAAPVQRAILAGDRETGVCIMQMQAGLDTGPYASVSSIHLGENNADVTTKQLAEIGAQLLLDTLSHVIDGTVHWTAQSEEGITYANKITKEELTIGSHMTALEIVRIVRASTAQAPCRMPFGDTVLQVVIALVEATSSFEEGTFATLGPGQIGVSKKSVVIMGADSNKLVVIEKLKPAGKQAMNASDYARGAHLVSGQSWG